MLTPSEVRELLKGDPEHGSADLINTVSDAMAHLGLLYSTELITPERMLELGATLSEDDDDEWWELDGVDVLNAAGMWMVGEVRVHTVGQLLMSVSVVKMQWELEEDAGE